MKKLELEEKEMKTLLKRCEKNPFDVTIKEMYDIVFYYAREGRMGKIRFPKRIRDLYEKVSESFGANKLKLTSDMIELLNNKPRFKYEKTKFSDTKYALNVKREVK